MVSSDELFWHNSSANNANATGLGTLGLMMNYRYRRVREIRRTRRTCPANFENVQRGVLISPDKMSGKGKSRRMSDENVQPKV